MQYFRVADISASSIGIKQFIKPVKFAIESFIKDIMLEKFTIINVTISIYWI